jgi:hypothetical protein
MGIFSGSGPFGISSGSGPFGIFSGSGPMGIFSGEDCITCFPVGPDAMQILAQVLSGNLAGALQSAGVVPTNGVDCTSGTCQVNPIMDGTPGQQAFDLTNPINTFNNLFRGCYNDIHDGSAFLDYSSLLSLTSLRNRMAVTRNLKEIGTWGTLKIVTGELFKYGSDTLGAGVDALAIAGTVNTAAATTIDLAAAGVCTVSAGAKVAGGNW